MKAINRNHLVAIAVGALLLSGSNLALVQADDHKKEDSRSKHGKKVEPIKIKGGVGVLILNTSTVVPTFQFDTSTVVPHIEIDADHHTPRFDTSTATSPWPPLQFPAGAGSHHADDGDDDGADDGDDEGDDDSGIISSSPLGVREG